MTLDNWAVSSALYSFLSLVQVPRELCQPDIMLAGFPVLYSRTRLMRLLVSFTEDSREAASVTVLQLCPQMCGEQRPCVALQCGGS